MEDIVEISEGINAIQPRDVSPYPVRPIVEAPVEEGSGDLTPLLVMAVMMAVLSIVVIVMYRMKYKKNKKI